MEQTVYESNVPRVYTLYRVSTIGQVEKDDIPMQKQVCRDFAKKQGWVVVKEFSEKGISGYKVSAKDRDAIQEIQVVVAPYDVRQSGFTGGGINAITKQGTNETHGSAYTYFNNQNMYGKYSAVRGYEKSPMSQQFDRTYGGTLQLNNTCCKKEDEVIDLKFISLITNFAFEGCMSKNIVHSDTIHSIHSHALDGYMLFCEDEWTDGIKSLGSVLIDVDSNADVIELPAKIEAVYNPDIIKPIKKVIIHSKKQLPLMKSKISAETVAFGKEFNLDSLQFFENSVYGIQAENIEIPEDNQFFCSVDGVVFSKDKKTLVSYPKDKKGKYEIPEGTKTIWRNAFKESNIPAVKIADSITHIQSYAFNSCSNLESIEFGAGISDFGFFGSCGIFASCKSLKEIELPLAAENLAPYMFDGSPIEAITFHEGLKQIKSYDFTDCLITDITFPTSLESIGSYNFYSLETARVTNRIPDGLIRCMTRRWNPNDRDVSHHPAIKDLLYTIVITKNGEEKTLYIPRYLALGASSEVDTFLSNFSWNLQPESYYNMLFEKCTEEFLQQETAIALYMINCDEEIKKYLKKASRKIVNRLLREENEEKFATFLQFGLLTERVLDSLFRTA